MHWYTLPVTVLTLWVAPPKLKKCSSLGIGFNGAESNCGIAHDIGILLMNSYDFILSKNNLLSVLAEHII